MNTFTIQLMQQRSVLETLHISACTSGAWTFGKYRHTLMYHYDYYTQNTTDNEINTVVSQEWLYEHF